MAVNRGRPVVRQRQQSSPGHPEERCVAAYPASELTRHRDGVEVLPDAKGVERAVERGLLHGSLQHDMVADRSSI
jgi:hypothetical protein